MEDADCNNTSACNSVSESVSKCKGKDSIGKYKIKTKNGLLNGISEDSDHSKKHITKELKKSKKGTCQTAQKVDTCREYKEETKLKDETIESKKESSQIKENQSKSCNKSDSKRKRHKAKTNNTEINVQKTEEPCSTLKYDLDSIINSTVNKENLYTQVTEGPSTSHTNSNFLDYQDNSNEFEKQLIESIKNLKIQHEAAPPKPELAEIKNVEPEKDVVDIFYIQYESELQMPMIMKIIQKDLSEPYSIYTYRYFIHNWPKLCFLAMCEEKCVGAIVCKLDFHRKSTKRGYIAMLAVDKDYRKRSIGSTLVRRAITEMIEGGADEVVLETEVTNKPALRLYEQLGFVRDKRLFRYYLNGVDALRLKLWLR